MVTGTVRYEPRYHVAMNRSTGTRAGRSWIHAAAAGAAAGTHAMVMVSRLNPGVGFVPGGMVVGTALWATWGVFAAGLPIALVLWCIERLRHRPTGRRTRWPAPVLTAAVYLLAAVLSRVNADIHPEFLSGSAHRILGQDAIAWGIGAVLALVVGAMLRHAGASNLHRFGFGLFFVLLPLVRLVWQPTPPQSPDQMVPRPLGVTSGSVVVIGVEGLDSGVLIGQSFDARTPRLRALLSGGAWGPLHPIHPYLRDSLWTTLATGAEPGRHGVKASRAWSLPRVFEGPLLLLPWTPQGSRLILPWWCARRVEPPTAGLPPLWSRLAVSGVGTQVVGWPGLWPPSSVELPAEGSTGDVAPGESRRSTDLEEALAGFPEARDPILRTIARDEWTIQRAAESLADGDRDVWVNLEEIAVVRRFLEPRRSLDTRERQIVDLVLELLDHQVGRLVDLVPANGLVVLVSPYGMARPGPFEHVRRLVGAGGSWRAAPDSLPDGILLMVSPGVRPGHRFPGADVTDVVPTICYLLGLPVAQYMEGRIVLDALDPQWVENHSLRVVD